MSASLREFPQFVSLPVADIAWAYLNTWGTILVYLQSDGGSAEKIVDRL
jgi:hypothetical protein